MTKPPVLPEKEWFTLEEIAQRWGTDRETLLHLAENGSLEVCRQCGEVILRDGTFYESHRGHMIFRIAPNEIHQFCNYEIEWPMIYSIGVPGEPEKNYSIILGVDNLPVAKFGRVLDLLVTRSERDRFEAAYRIGAHAGTMPKADREGQLDPRTERTYLQIIRVMSAELKLPPEPYKAAEILSIYAARHGSEWPKKLDTVANKLRAARELED